MKRKRCQTYIHLHRLEDEDPLSLVAVQKLLNHIGYSLDQMDLVRLSLDSAEGAQMFSSRIASGEIAAVAAYSLADVGDDGTSIEAFLRFVALLAEKRVRFLSVKDEIDSLSPASTFIPAVLAGVARAKKIVKTNKIRRGLRQSSARGVRIGRPKKANDAQIRALRARGFSFQEISSKLKISKGSIQYSLRHGSVSER